MTTGLAALSYSVLTLLLKAELGINFAEPSRASLAGRTCGQGQARRVAKTREEMLKEDPQGRVVLRAILTLEMLL